MTYGYELYRENKFLFSYSRKILKGIHIGTALNYHLVTIKNYGNDGAIYLNIGSLAYLSQQIRFGFNFSNINSATWGSEKDQIPLLMDMGFSYTYPDVLIISASLRKDIRYKAGLSAGIEYTILDILSIRSGISTEPLKYASGTGIHISHFTFDYAFFLHQELGITHQISIIFSFNEFTNRMKEIRYYHELQ
jgi:hypothetical protein